MLQYGYVLVDEHIEKVGNWTLEPSSLFRGRGTHPKMGKLKLTVLPEMVELNMDENSVVPACPIKGHAWGGVVHKRDVKYV
jgi:DNA topoisomerase-1